MLEDKSVEQLVNDANDRRKILILTLGSGDLSDEKLRLVITDTVYY